MANRKPLIIDTTNALVQQIQSGDLLVDQDGHGYVDAAAAFGTDNVMLRSDGTARGCQHTGIFVTDDDFVGIGTTSEPSFILEVAGDTNASTLAIFQRSTADVNGFNTLYRKSRGTLASPGNITSGDTVGGYFTQGWVDGNWSTDFLTRFRALAYGTSTGAGMMPCGWEFFTTDQGQSAGRRTFFMDGAGNVGIFRTQHLNVNTFQPSGGGTPVLIVDMAASDPTGLVANTAGIFAKDVGGSTRIHTVGEDGHVSQINHTLLGFVAWNGGAVFNEPGDDVDFRVEGDSATHLLSIDATFNAFQVGSNTAGSLMQAIPGAGNGVVFNELAQDHDFRIEGTTCTHLFVVDAGNNAVTYNGTGGTSDQIASFDPSGGVSINEHGANRDFKVEGDTLTHMIFLDATSTTENIALLTTGAPNWQGMDIGLFVGDNSAAPSGNPTSGHFYYSNAGVPTFRTSGGAIINLNTSSAYTPTNVTTDRSFDADTVLITELADVVGTLIADLQARGLLG